jgi:hypothetical protein
MERVPTQMKSNTKMLLVNEATMARLRPASHQDIGLVL